MFGKVDFIACITQNLGEKGGFGEKRLAEVKERFEGLASSLEEEGLVPYDAYSIAMTRVFAEVAQATKEKAKRAAKNLQVMAQNNDRIAQAIDINVGKLGLARKGSRGTAFARGAISLIQGDPRFKGTSVEQIKWGLRDKYMALMADSLDKFGKGAFGRQKGAAHDKNVVREILGEDTGDVDAKAFAESFLKVNRIAVDDRNLAGGSLAHIENHIPQAQSAVKVSSVAFEKWRDDHMGWLDWDKMRWPSGDKIKPAEREDLLRNIYETLKTDGAAKIDPTKMRGMGSSVGNQLDRHRFLIYKDAEAWISQHEVYGEGSVFDVMYNHVEKMSNDTALVQMFGPNPELAAQNIRAIVRKKAAEVAKAAKPNSVDAQAVAHADAELKTFDNMFDVMMHRNAMDPHSPWGSLALTTSNMLTAIQLGSVPLLAVAGDMVQTVAVRFANHMPLLDGIGMYMKNVTLDYKFAEKIAAQTGWVFDETVSSTYAASRFNSMATYGPAWSRKVTETVMRMSALTRHTNAARWTNISEHMGLLNRQRHLKFDELPNKAVLQRYGIEEADWDAVRKTIDPWSPQKGAEMLRPLDILNSNLPNKDDLYRKFYGMIAQEARYMVPGSTLEAQVALKGTTRPDTLHGIILHSFSMYKNFPVTMMQMYGRLAMAMEGGARRTGFIAGLGLGLVGVGALGLQLRELTKGRTPLDMRDARFWGRALMAGGSLGIWGDFLFSGVNEQGRGPETIAAGPLAGLAADTANLAFGDGFKFVEALDKGEQYKGNFAARAVEFARRNTPGSSIWWARLVLEREVFDTMQEWADPQAAKKQRQKIQRQRSNFGNDFYWAPGSRVPN